MRNRSVGSHSMNEHSSRSHTILTVNITSEQQVIINLLIMFFSYFIFSFISKFKVPKAEFIKDGNCI